MVTVPSIRTAMVHIHAPGGFRMRGKSRAQFHYVVNGSATIECNSASTVIDLRPGDFVLFPRPQRHLLFGTSTETIVEGRYFEADEDTDRDCDIGAPTSIRVGSGRAETGLILVGTFSREKLAHNPLFAALPPVVLRSHHGQSGVPHYFSDAETGSGPQTLHGPGSSEITRRFVDLKLAQIVHDHALRQGLMNLMPQFTVSVAQVSAARRLIEREPERPWTVASLAHEVGMSRSAFSAAFSRIVGKTPMGYLTGVRMERAIELLKTSSLPVLAVSHAVGFLCETSFSRAFKRFTGTSPRSFRGTKVIPSLPDEVLAPWDPFLQ